jgi:hypothetical protein
MNEKTCRTLSAICFQFGMISIFLSIAIWWLMRGETPEEMAHAERFGIFVGLWAPTLLILSNRFDRYADKAALLPGQVPENLEERDPAR